jgi:hypothetical protein
MSAVWPNISMDFIEGFLTVNGKSVILTVVDRFSKYAQFMALNICSQWWCELSLPTLLGSTAC